MLNVRMCFVGAHDRFKHRREATRVMRSYVNDVVWRGVADSRQRALRAVLYRAPFRIRSPMDMVQRAQALSRQVRTVPLCG